MVVLICSLEALALMDTLRSMNQVHHFSQEQGSNLLPATQLLPIHVSSVMTLPKYRQWL